MRHGSIVASQRLVAVATQNMSPQQIGGYVRIHAEALSHCVPMRREETKGVLGNRW